MKEFQNQKSIKIKNKYNILESISFPKEYNISWQKIVRVVNIFRIKFKIETLRDIFVVRRRRIVISRIYCFDFKCD